MRRQEGRPRRRTVPALLTGLALVLALGAALAWWTATPTLLAPPTAPTIVSPEGAGPARARRETRPTLDPALFVGRPRFAHEVARAMPDVLDQLYCYCECDKHSGHRSLLSCYTDGHAPT
jgi:hypothetical protein